MEAEISFWRKLRIAVWGVAIFLLILLAILAVVVLLILPGWVAAVIAVVAITAATPVLLLHRHLANHSDPSEAVAYIVTVVSLFLLAAVAIAMPLYWLSSLTWAGHGR
jgi:c-di-AMP phosphodiesterase-like protein